MKLEKDRKFVEESTRRFRIDIRNLTNVDLNTQKSQRFSLEWAPFEQNINCLN